MGKIFILFIKIYQKITAARPQVCRFYPSCSSYATEAIQKHGAAKGLFMGTKRVLKCHPFHPGGHDPVREIDENRHS